MSTRTSEKLSVTTSLLSLLLATAWTAAPALAQAESAGETAVAAAVGKRLDNKGLGEEPGIQVAVDRGTVVLEGIVETLREKQKAEVLAGKVAGVASVDNRLGVAGYPRPDGEIRDDLQDVLDVYLRDQVFDWVDAMVEDGQVLLTGRVYDASTLGRIERAVSNLDGVRALASSVEILPVSAFDDQLRREALLAIYTHPMFSHGPLVGNAAIHILVADGRIELRGNVPTEAWSRLAESLVRSGTLSYGVENQILVESRQRS